MQKCVMGGNVHAVGPPDSMYTAGAWSPDGKFAYLTARIVALGDVLKELARIDARQSRVVELRFFGGLTLEEISAALDLVLAMVQRDWTSVRAWLYREISGKSRA